MPSLLVPLRSIGPDSWREVRRPGMPVTPRFGLAAVLLLAGLVGPAWGQLSEQDLEELRKRGEREGWTFTVGESDATHRSLDQLCGLVEPADWRETSPADPPPFDDRGDELPAAFDWRDLGGCTPIRNQGSCGSCWAFAAIGTVESAVLINEGLSENLSEQWLVSCTQAGSCAGGWHTGAYAYMRPDDRVDPCGDYGAVFESDFPYVAWDAPCGCPYPHPYWIASWRRIGGSSGGIPPVDTIKRAILDFGPVAVACYVDGAFQGYSGGVFNSCASGTVNHAVVLVGWDDSQGSNGVWILRNSWGTWWGEGGYMRIEYECSRVGYAAAKVIYRFDCNDNEIRDDWDIADCDGSAWCGDCNGNGVPDECDIAGETSGDCNGNGVPDECDVDASGVVYVDADATGAGTGANWGDALTDLGTAVCLAQSGLGVTEIWMRAGTYTPAGPGGDRAASFQLLSGIALRGGFAGTETSPDQRDLSDPSSRTILSGDLNRDDEPGFVNNGDNSFHVVTSSGADTTAVLDGFVIVGGNANGLGPDDCGGGLLNLEGSPTVINCVFVGNAAAGAGGGVHNAGESWGSSQPAFTNCAFSGNTAGMYGGAVSSLGTMLRDVSPTLTNCSISRNSSEIAGGVYSAGNCDPTLTNCLLWGNRDVTGTTESAQICGVSSIVNYCCVQGLTGELGGVGNIGGAPMLADPDGIDGLLGTPDDDLRLRPCSPCTDAGDNASVPAEVTIDLGGSPRYVDDTGTSDTGNPPDGAPIVDIGAYEFQGTSCFGDLTGDGAIDLADLAVLLANYRVTSGAAYEDGDLDRDGDVDLADLATLLAAYGEGCP